MGDTNVNGPDPGLEATAKVHQALEVDVVEPGGNLTCSVSCFNSSSVGFGLVALGFGMPNVELDNHIAFFDDLALDHGFAVRRLQHGDDMALGGAVMRATRSGNGCVVPMASVHSSTKNWRASIHLTGAAGGISTAGGTAPRP